MTIMDWCYLIGLISAVLALLFFILFLFLTIKTGNKVRKLNKLKPKNKNKRKQLYFAKKREIKKKKRQRRSAILFLLTALLLVGGVFATIYYQSMNLTAEDSDSISQGYYLLEDFSAELDKSAVSSESQEKLENNLRYLSSSIASYGTKKASIVNTQDGQLILNRYYNGMKELGTNAMNNYNKFYGNKELVEEYKKDIEKVKAYEQKVIKMYNINQAALEQRK